MSTTSDFASAGTDWRALSPITLRFADETEEERYRRTRDAADLRYARIVLLLVLALALSIVPLDLLIFSSESTALLFAGHGAEMAVILLLLGLSFLPFFRRRHMILMAALALFFAGIYGTWNALFEAPPVYVAGGALVIAAIYVLLPFDIVWGVATALAASVLYLAIVGLGQSMTTISFLILAFLMATANAIGAVSLYHVERLRRLDFANLEEIAAQRTRYRDLLGRILPQSVADRLQRGEHNVADRFDNSTVLFADLVGFTPAAAHHRPEEVVAFLDRVFAAFDALVAKNGVEKIKTIGDAYMVAGGVPARQEDHAARIANLALQMLEAVRTIQPLEGPGVGLRIGISCGPVVAGVIGDTRFGYDLWGDTVNVASRMEAYGEPGHIQVSESAFERLNGGFALKPRGKVPIKGLGTVPTWYLLKPLGGA